MALDLLSSKEFLARLAELSSAVRDLAGQNNSARKIIAFYREVRRAVAAFDQKKGLGYRPGAIVCTRTITTGSGGIATAYGVSADEDFIVYRVRGILTFNNWDAEPELATAEDLGNNPTERAYVKASNCKLNIKDKDLSGVQIAGDPEDLVLASILPEVGGLPLEFGGPDRPAWIVPHSHHPEVKVTLSDTATALIGASSDYGACFEGVFLRRES